MKQHYIPRCYLRRFSDNEKSIYTYDKLCCRKYNASMMSVCCEDDLYTMSNEYVRSNNGEGKSTIDKLIEMHLTKMKKRGILQRDGARKNGKWRLLLPVV